jgi:hypothetical protein
MTTDTAKLVQILAPRSIIDLCVYMHLSIFYILNTHPFHKYPKIDPDTPGLTAPE